MFACDNASGHMRCFETFQIILQTGAGYIPFSMAIRTSFPQIGCLITCVERNKYILVGIPWYGVLSLGNTFCPPIAISPI